MLTLSCDVRASAGSGASVKSRNEDVTRWVVLPTIGGTASHATSSVERSVEVLDAAVHLDGDNTPTGTDAISNPLGGDEIGASRGAGEDALGLRGPAAIANASASGTVTTSSKSSGRSSGGHDPMPPPSMWWVPGTPPESTADSPGSTTTRWRVGS